MLKKGMILQDKYRLKELLGKGSSGQVFLASSLEGKGLYTIKASGKIDLLRREGELYKEIAGNCFPALIEYLEEAGEGYLVLEYIEGVSLQYLLDKGRSFSEEEIQAVMDAVTSGLSYLHYHNPTMIHLDVKPDNILITTKGMVRMIDMGAGMCMGTESQRKGGTYGYGAPEQFWQGVEVGPEADVYACGKLMAYLFTGKNPCHPPYDVEKEIIHSRRTSKGWQQIILKCLEIEPAMRYPNAGMLRKELMELWKGGKETSMKRIRNGAEITYLKSIWKSDYERL